MKAEITELEMVLNQEIEAYLKLEECVYQKKDSLVNGDIDRLKEIDMELERFTTVVEKLEAERVKATSKISNRNISLKEIIGLIEEKDQDQARRISETRDKLKQIVGNIKKQNTVNAKLIEHSLNIVKFSVNSIVNMLIPETSSYNNFGRVNGSSNTGISSVIHDA